ncbi:MAG: hypothetical protein ACD_39C00459G0002 [uncultured bacterium]|nr:MAG: hypothetical protein ACD_39C00459G0002 [uncultured bacterium]
MQNWRRSFLIAELKHLRCSIPGQIELAEVLRVVTAVHYHCVAHHFRLFELQVVMPA